MNYTINQLDELDIVVTYLAQLTATHTIFCFYGQLGSGKTTTITHLCKYLGVQDTISSPTFSIVQEYHIGTKKIYHIDLYRLKNDEEAFDIGLEDYLYSGNLCFIEWPNKFLSLIPPNHIKVKITNFESKRTFEITENK